MKLPENLPVVEEIKNLYRVEKAWRANPERDRKSLRQKPDPFRMESAAKLND